jgi:hypothetical protein
MEGIPAAMPADLQGVRSLICGSRSRAIPMARGATVVTAGAARPPVTAGSAATAEAVMAVAAPTAEAAAPMAVADGRMAEVAGTTVEAAVGTSAVVEAVTLVVADTGVEAADKVLLSGTSCGTRSERQRREGRAKRHAPSLVRCFSGLVVILSRALGPMQLQ